MKMTISSNTRIAELVTETPDDMFLLGKLASKLKGKAHVYPQPGDQRTLQVDLKDLFALLAD